MGAAKVATTGAVAAAHPASKPLKTQGPGAAIASGLSQHLPETRNQNEKPSGFSGKQAETIARLHAAGFKLLPLGGGPDGKKPAIANWSDARGCSVATCLHQMEKAGSQMYGIRLGGLMVVDCDTDNDQTRDYVEQHFGLSPFMTRTAKGLHYWFRFRDGDRAPSKVRLSGIAIDFKHGAGSFVVGPGSVRPDNGVAYQPIGNPLGFIGSLPPFSAVSPPTEWEVRAPSGKIAVGNRNGALWRRALELVSVSESADEVLGELQAFRDLDCDDPETVPDSELMGLVRWAFASREREGFVLWSGQNSQFKKNRRSVVALASVKNGGDGSLLYDVLVSKHGHVAGKFFTIVADGLIAKGHLPKMSRSQIYRARDTLIEVDLLEKVFHGRRKEPHLYRLRLPGLVPSKGRGEVK